MMPLHTRAEAVVQQHLGETFPACAVCVLREGEIALEAAWGWIDAERRTIPVTTATYFDLASVTKLFTATAFFSLVGAGAVTLDDPLVAVVPEFGQAAPRAIDGGQDPHSKQRQPVDPAFAGQTVDPARVTFRHLLTHTSGLPPWRDVFNAAGPPPTPPDQPEPLPRPQRWARALEALCAYPFVGVPDGVVRYSDIGLMLLGEATARLHGGDDLWAAVRARVLEPLGRSDVVFNPVREGGLVREQIAPTEADPGWRKRRVWGEVHDENACGVGGVAGHAGLFAPARAVAALGQAWLEPTRSLGLPPALAADAVQLQAEYDSQRRGLGFALKAEHDSSAGDVMGARTFGHTGFTGTSLWIDPDARLVVACLTNSVYPGRWHGGTHEFRRAMHDVIAGEA
jgi:CubicO group peptidase (beta-lactamase class C family)